MLDQSFSAHNIETIYCLESRKGNIDIHTMPYEYQEIIANQINSSTFKFSLNKWITKDNKEVFTIDVKSHAHFLRLAISE